MRVIKSIWQQSVRQFTIYRATSLMTFSLALVFYGIELLTGYVYFEADLVVKGWSRSDYFVLITAIALITYLYDFFFLIGHEELSFHILEGTLDQQLLRPVDPYWFVSAGNFDLPSLFNALCTSGVLVYLLAQYDLSFMQLIGLLSAVFLGVVFLFVIDQLLVCLAFWFESPLSFTGLVEDLTDLLSRPKVFLPKVFQLFFLYVLPFLLLSNLPVMVVKGQKAVWSLGYLALLDLGLYLLSKVVWKRGLTHYVSAN